PRRAVIDAPDRDIPSLDTLIPSDSNKPYDMKRVIENIVDEGDYFEIKPEFAGNIITCFARMNGDTVGIVANQPTVLAGCL
ncbi:MAG: carboxyl transferase domain-containing protein, partial [Alphaproteobacteria bacterium]